MTLREIAMSLPALLPNGYLPPGVHEATLGEVVERFGTNTPRRQVLASRLQELVGLARETRKLRRLFIWDSFVTDKLFPRDLDVFLLMQEGFDREFSALSPPQWYVFEHESARLLFEADIFWATEAIGAAVLTSWLSVYRLTRDMGQRGIAEVILDD
jgi:hypothetical protein